MVARKLSSFDTTVSLESFAKQQRPSIYIDPDSNIYDDLQYLQNIDRKNCVNCMHLWRSNKEGKSFLFHTHFIDSFDDRVNRQLN